MIRFLQSLWERFCCALFGEDDDGDIPPGSFTVEPISVDPPKNNRVPRLGSRRWRIVAVGNKKNRKWIKA